MQSHGYMPVDTCLGAHEYYTIQRQCSKHIFAQTHAALSRVRPERMNSEYPPGDAVLWSVSACFFSGTEDGVVTAGARRQTAWLLK